MAVAHSFICPTAPTGDQWFYRRALPVTVAPWHVVNPTREEVVGAASAWPANAPADDRRQWPGQAGE